MNNGAPDWITADADTERPSIARFYDYLLGGTHHLEVDRELGRKAIRAAPGLILLMRENRKFLRRAVKCALDAGIDQFLDIGSGIPARGSIHETARKAGSRARVAYVDIDPVAVSEGKAILAGDPDGVSVLGDVFEPAAILENPEVRALIDLDRPVVLLILNVIHFFPDSKVLPVLETYRNRLVSGSMLGLSVAMDGTTGAEAIDELYRREYEGFTLRSREQIEALFGDLELLEPGVVYPPEWRPEDPGRTVVNPERYSSLVGVARKR